MCYLEMRKTESQTCKIIILEKKREKQHLQKIYPRTENNQQCHLESLIVTTT